MEKATRGLADTLNGTQPITYQGRPTTSRMPFRRVTVEQAIIDHNPGIDPLSLRDLTYLRKCIDQLGITFHPQDGAGKLQIGCSRRPRRARSSTRPSCSPTRWKIPRCRARTTPTPSSPTASSSSSPGAISPTASPSSTIRRSRRRVRAQVARKDNGDEEATFYDADYVRALEYGMPPTAGLGGHDGW